MMNTVSGPLGERGHSAFCPLSQVPLSEGPRGHQSRSAAFCCQLSLTRVDIASEGRDRDAVPSSLQPGPRAGRGDARLSSSGSQSFTVTVWEEVRGRGACLTGSRDGPRTQCPCELHEPTPVGAFRGDTSGVHISVFHAPSQRPRAAGTKHPRPGGETTRGSTSAHGPGRRASLRSWAPLRFLLPGAKPTSHLHLIKKGEKEKLKETHAKQGEGLQ